MGFMTDLPRLHRRCFSKGLVAYRSRMLPLEGPLFHGESGLVRVHLLAGFASNYGLAVADLLIPPVIPLFNFKELSITAQQMRPLASRPASTACPFRR